MPEIAELFNFEEAGLKTDKNTVREHTVKNKEAIGESVSEVGFCRSIFVDEENQVLAGKGVSEEAEKRGAKILYIDVDDPNVLVAVRRRGLTEEQKVRAMLWDNRASDLSKNNKAAIRRIATQNPKQRLLKGIFSEKDEKRLLVAQADAQPLAEGGAGEVVVERKQIRQESNIKMVQLMLTTETHPEFTRKAYALGAKLFNLRNINDILVALVNHAYNEWVGESQESESNSATAAA